MNNKLIIVRGIPGTGKSTFCREMFPDIFHLENDMFQYQNGEYHYDEKKLQKSIQWCFNTASNALKNGMDVVISNTFTKKAFVDSYTELVKKYKCNFEIYRMMGNFKDIHNVPEDVLKSMKDGFEDYEGEKFVYPNFSYNPDDELSQKYCFTKYKVGDKIKMNLSLPSYEATITDIYAGDYGMITIKYETDDGNQGLVYSGDIEKV